MLKSRFGPWEQVRIAGGGATGNPSKRTCTLKDSEIKSRNKFLVRTLLRGCGDGGLHGSAGLPAGSLRSPLVLKITFGP